MKKIISLLLSVLLITSFVGCSKNIPTEPNEDKTTTVVTTTKVNKTDDIQDGVLQDLAKETSELIEQGHDLATGEVYESDIKSEDKLEEDGTLEQTDISYDGTEKIKPDGIKLLGNWQGITYYAQNDTRWAKVPYTSIGDNSQTIKSSGCGPTSAAMIVSSSKGAILPTTMASLFVKKGFRTPANGTAWSAFSYVADYFDFKKYSETTSYDKAFNYLNTDENKDGVPDYFIIATCASGLWTTGGHYIAILHINGNSVGVSDPYPYNGKYGTSSRKAANVKMSGNVAYVTWANFKKYSNVKRFFIFSNDHISVKEPGTKVNYIRYVATESENLNVRKSPSTNSEIVKTIKKGTKVTVTEVKGSWSSIGKDQWVSSAYLSSTPVNEVKPVKIVNYKTEVGKTYTFKSSTDLYSKGNLTGTKYTYKSGTKAKVISHYSDKVDYVYIASTGRYAYVKVSSFDLSNKTKVTYKTKVNKSYTLNKKTTLYSKGNLTGTTYSYVAGTKVTVLSHYSDKVDKIKVVKTGRIAYVRVADLS